MVDAPVMLVFLNVLGIYLTKLWRDDCAVHVAAQENRVPLPGATPACSGVCLIGATGALLILAGKTAAEISLGVFAGLSEMTGLFGFFTLAAAMIEELIFPDFLIVEGHGPRGESLGAIAASIVFMLLHHFLRAWKDGASTSRGTCTARSAAQPSSPARSGSTHPLAPPLQYGPRQK